MINSPNPLPQWGRGESAGVSPTIGAIDGLKGEGETEMGSLLSALIPCSGTFKEVGLLVTLSAVIRGKETL